jgi:DMSO reductase anchor subunit
MADSVSTWRIVLAAILDFLTVFIVGGWLIALFTGNTTESGFNLSGWPALLLFGLVVAYFGVAKRMGGTLWQRILCARR